MSLDVWLELKDELPKIEKIFIREDGQTKELTEEEWFKRFPHLQPTRCSCIDNYVYERNITHNLTKMADEAGIYQHLWRPEELGITKAKELIEPLTNGLYLLESDPARFEKHNPENGWGDYEGLCDFVKSYLGACKEYPEATIGISR